MGAINTGYTVTVPSPRYKPTQTVICCTNILALTSANTIISEDKDVIKRKRTLGREGGDAGAAKVEPPMIRNFTQGFFTSLRGSTGNFKWFYQ
jgi:hypothetical protein